MRTAEITRNTRETQITAKLNLDGLGTADVSTGIGFFDHMLTALAMHATMDITLKIQGDLEVDCHHSIEDAGIVLGMAFAKALGDKVGIARYGAATIPMDEALAACNLDISGRPFLVFNATFVAPLIGGMDSQMIEEFFRAFAQQAGITMHINLQYGKNDHHKAEAIFKAVARSLQAAKVVSGSGVLSTKGVL